MADVERERVTALWREAAAALESGDDAWPYDSTFRRLRDSEPCAECGRLREQLRLSELDYEECAAARDIAREEAGRLREQLDAARQALAPFVTRGTGPDRPVRAPTWEIGGQYVVWLEKGEWERGRAAPGVEGEQE